MWFLYTEKPEDLDLSSAKIKSWNSSAENPWIVAHQMSSKIQAAHHSPSTSPAPSHFLAPLSQALFPRVFALEHAKLPPASDPQKVNFFVIEGTMVP